MPGPTHDPRRPLELPADELLAAVGGRGSEGPLVGASSVAGMAGTAGKVWTTDELRELTPAQRDALLRERTVTDLETADPELVAWARAEGRRHLDEQGLLPTGQG